MKIKVNQITELISYVREKGFFHLLSANILIQVVAFASQLLVAGILAPDDIGRIKIIQTYLSIFSIVAGMGFSASTLKLCSENRTEKEQTDLFRSALFFTFVSTIVLYLIILLLNSFGLFSADKLILWIIPIGLFPIISNSLFMVFVSYFQAIKEIKLMSKLTISNKIISIISIVVLTYWFGIKGYYVAYNLSFIFMLFVSFRVLKSVFSKNFSYSETKKQLPVHWYYAKTSVFTSIVSEIAVYLDILLINIFVTDMQEIGYYSFALTLTVALRIFPGSVQQITVPYFSSLSHKKEEFLKLFKKYNRLLYIVVIITFILSFLLVPFFIEFVFKGKYDKSINYFLILSVGWSIRQLVQLQSGAIFSLGKINYNLYTSIISLVFNTILFSVSLYYFGITGAAYASIPGNILVVILSRYFLRKATLKIS